MFDAELKEDVSAVGLIPDPDAKLNSGHILDSPENKELFDSLLSYYQREIDRQYDNRIAMAKDEDFYDHIQWTEEEASELQKRGQAPIVYNVLSQTINWIIGSEKRGRVDFKVLPRREEDLKPAERKTQLLKYLSDVNKTPFHRSRAFEDAVKVGIGWLEDGVQDTGDNEPIYSRYESWRNMMWDSASTEMDLSDCRYVTRSKWLDVDVAMAMFPGRKDIIYVSKEEGQRYGFDGMYSDEVMDQVEIDLDSSSADRATDYNYRDRVRLIEVWFRKPVKVSKVIDGDWRGEIYEKETAPPGLREYVEGQEYVGKQVVADRLMMRMHCAIMTTQGLLYLGVSPYRHNQFPFTPIWGYRKGRDNLPYGVIRGLIDIQEDINKRASKALYILSTNKVVMDEGAVDDIEEFREEIARPDAVIEKKPGKALDLNVDRDLAQWHVELMARNINMIQQVGGVTDELLGRTTNAVSGKAIQSRQDQGALTTGKLFDNHRLAFNLQGAKELSLVEQFMGEKQSFRITNSRGAPEFINVNDGLPENDITKTKADFVISDSEWRATLRQSQAEQMTELLTRMPPEVALVMLDLVVELMDLPNRDELVKRIRNINGMPDPDADPNSPEEQQRLQAQAAQQQMQQAMAEAEIRQKMAEAGKTEAEIQKIAVDIQKAAASIAADNIDSQDKAIDAAVKAVLNQPAIPVADKLLHESGFVSRSEKERAMAIEQDQQARAAEEQQQMAQAQAAQQIPETPEELPSPQQNPGGQEL
jgi:hypothetical protein